MIVREMQPEIDDERLDGFEASFTTGYVYRVEVDKMSVEIIEEKLAAPFYKTYTFDSIKNDIAEADFAVVVEIEKAIAGFATVKYEAWNNRAVLSGIFVALEFRGKNIGQSLVEAAINYAKAKRARCLFVETQNVNYPAIQFYLKMNFEFCGFDRALYKPFEVSPDETAFYFCKNLS